MPRRRRRNPLGELPYDTWIPAHAVMFNSDGTISLMAEAGDVEEYEPVDEYASAENRGRRRRNRLVPFDESTESVMIRRSGYPLWIEGQKLIDPVQPYGEWRGRVAVMTHPDYDMGDMVNFTGDEVRDTE